MPAKYDTIGVNYSNLRRPEPRIAAMIEAALGPAARVLNVGAGSGSYEPSGPPVGRTIIALEPSAEMIRQRRVPCALAVQGRAEALPFKNKTFDAAMAVLTVHHWSDKAHGMAELCRVTDGPIAILTFDPAYSAFWLADYLPELKTLDADQMPAMDEYEAWLGPVTITSVPVPHDCVDGFLGAYWRRPSAYLDPRIRAAISCFWSIPETHPGLMQLLDDLDSGAWAERYGDLLEQDTHDVGYRLVTAEA